MKAALATDCLNMHVYLNKPFAIVCYTSEFQMVSYILQDGRPVVYWSKSFSPTTEKTEKELLAIMLTLKEYRRMFLGSKLVIYTDHKYLTFQTLST